MIDQTPDARPSRRWLITGLTFAGTAFVLGLVLHLQILPEEVSANLSSVTYPIISLGSGVLLSLAALRLKGRARWSWFIIGMGVACWGIGETIWAYYAWILDAEVPYPGWADVFYVAGYPLIFAGILALPHVRAGFYERVRITLDAVAGTIAITAISWITYLGDNLYIDPELSFAEQAINILYPVGDVVILVSVIILAVRRSEHRFDGRLLALSLGLVVTAVADVVYLVEYDSYVDGSWIDALWLYGYGAFAVTAYLVTRPLRNVDQAYRPPQVWKLAVPYAAIVTLLLMSLVQLGETAGILQYSATAVVLLVVARQTVAIRENRELIEKQRDDLVASVSHELRTPLTSIQGFTQLLSEHWDQLPDAQRHEFIKTINEQSEHLGKITTDLVEVARDRLHATEIKKHHVDLSTITDRALAIIAGSSTVVTADVPRGLIIDADPDRLTQVFVNLLTNGQRYGKSEIRLDARRVNGHVQIAVHDNGPGVPRKYESLIWERFERGAHRFDTATPGSGIGLPIAKALVEAHGGAIGYKTSLLLGGACFEVSLPAVDAPEPAHV